MGYIKCIIITLFGMGFHLAGKAQPANDHCANAAFICSGMPIQGNNIAATTETGTNAADGAASGGTFCFNVDNTSWFYFTTNSTGGMANVSISNVNCLGTTGFDTEISAVVIEASVPCDANTYTAVSNCESASGGPVELFAVGLSPNTHYYVIVDGDLNGTSVTHAAACNFSITVNGQGVEPEVTTTLTDQTCGNTDGTLTVDHVSGGQPPYLYAINGGGFQAGNLFSGLTAGHYTLAIQDNAGCIHVVPTTQTIALTGGITGAMVATTDATCNQNDGIIQISNITGGNAPYSFLLYGGTPQVDPTFTNVGAGTHTITITDATGCPFVLETTVNNTNGPSNITYQISNASCGQSNGAISINTPSGGIPPYTYALNGGIPQNSNQFTGLSAGSYSVVVTDQNNCTYTLGALSVSEPLASLIPQVDLSATPSPACAGDPVAFTAIAINAGNAPNYDFFVNGISVQNSVGNVYNGVVNDGDVVTVTITSADPCMAQNTAIGNTITMTVFPYTSPSVSIASSTVSVCQGDPVNFSAVSTHCDGATYTWNVNGLPVLATTDSLFSTASLANGDQVTVTIACNNPCTHLANVTSTPIAMGVTAVVANAGPDLEIQAGQSVVLQGNGVGDPSWAPHSNLSSSNRYNPEASPQTTQTYFLTVTQNGCIATDEMVVSVLQPIVPPNAFTPNGDTYNDTWVIPGILRFPDNKVTIYNRWGQKVFVSSGYTSPWDGTNRGLKLPVATYYYIIQLDQADSDVGTISGAVTIIK